MTSKQYKTINLNEYSDIMFIFLLTNHNKENHVLVSCYVCPMGSTKKLLNILLIMTVTVLL